MTGHIIGNLDPLARTAYCTTCRASVTATFRPTTNVGSQLICPNESVKTTPKPAKVKKPRNHPERDIQTAIVEALELAGCSVMSTSAWRQKGPSGVMPGIPDLLVRWPGLPAGLVLGIEVKSATGKLSPEQVSAEAAGFSAGVARSPKEALTLCADRMDYAVPESIRLRVREVLGSME